MKTLAIALAFWAASARAEAQSVFVRAEPGAEDFAAGLRAELEALGIDVALERSEVEVACATDGSIEVRGPDAIVRFAPLPGEDAAARVVRAAEFVRARLLIAPELHEPASELADPSERPELREPAEREPTEPEPPEARAIERERERRRPPDAEEPPPPAAVERARGIGTSIGGGAGAWFAGGSLGPQVAIEAKASLLLGELVAVVGRFFYQLTEPTLVEDQRTMGLLSSSAHLTGFAIGGEVRFSPIAMLELGAGLAVGALRFDTTGTPSTGTGLRGRSTGAWLVWPQITASVHAWLQENVGVFVSGSAGLASSRVVVAYVAETEPGAPAEVVTVGTFGPFLADVTAGIEARWEY
jgi:hypothetical protein